MCNCRGARDDTRGCDNVGSQPPAFLIAHQLLRVNRVRKVGSTALEITVSATHVWREIPRNTRKVSVSFVVKRYFHVGRR